MVVVIVEQREFSGKAQRAKPLPRPTGNAVSAGRAGVVVKVDLVKQVEDHSKALSTNTFSEGT
jgi:hypothetical protein